MSEYSNVFSGPNYEGMIVKNILENNGVEVFEVSALMASIEPWAVTAGGANPLTLQVNHVDFEKAATIVAAYENGDYALEDPS